MPLFGGSKTPRGVSANQPAQILTPRSQPAGDFLPDGGFVCSIGTLTPEEVALARVNFKKFDADGDGVISRADFGAAMAKHDASWRNEDRRAQLDTMYDAVDLDGTGHVTFDKFTVMRVRKKLTAAQKQAKASAPPPAPPPQPHVTFDSAKPSFSMPPVPPMAMNPGMGTMGGMYGQQDAYTPRGGYAPAMSARGGPPGGGCMPPGMSALQLGALGGAPANPCMGANPCMPPCMAPLNMAALTAPSQGGLTARGHAPAGSGAGFASPRSTNFLMALSQTYYAQHPHGNGWLPTPQLYALLCQVAQQYALPLSAAQAAELCSLCDRGDGFSNLHEVLSMDSVARYFESFTPRGDATAAALNAAGVPSPHSARGERSGLDRSGRHTARGEPKRSSRRHREREPSDDGMPDIARIQAEARAAARAELQSARAAEAEEPANEGGLGMFAKIEDGLMGMFAGHDDSAAGGGSGAAAGGGSVLGREDVAAIAVRAALEATEGQGTARSGGPLDDTDAREQLASEIEARISASIASMLQDQFESIEKRVLATPRHNAEEHAANSAALAEAENAAKAAEAAAAAAAAVAVELESRRAVDEERLKESHEAEMADLSSQLEQLRQRLRDGQDKAASEKAAAEARVNALESQHDEELQRLRTEAASSQAELEVRRAAERRAKLELRARRDAASRAQHDAASARSELAKKDQEERAGRAREFQETVGLTPRGGNFVVHPAPPDDATSVDVSDAPAANDAVRAAPPATPTLALDVPSAQAAQAAQAASTPSPAGGRLTTRGLNQVGAAAAVDRYEQLTPRSGAKAAQIASISALMNEASADDDWTPRPTPRDVKAPSITLPSAAAPGKKPLTPQTESELRAAFRAARSEGSGGEAAGATEADGNAPPTSDRNAQRKEVRALQAAANEAAKQSVAAGADARKALQQGDLTEASRLAASAETHAAEARNKRKAAEELHALIAPHDNILTPREGAPGFAGRDAPTTARRTPPAPHTLGPVPTARPPPSQDAALCSDAFADEPTAGDTPLRPAIPKLPLRDQGGEMGATPAPPGTPAVEGGRAPLASARSDAKGIRGLFRRRGTTPRDGRSASPRDGRSASPRRGSSDEETENEAGAPGGHLEETQRI